jgi:cytochrome c553
MIRAMPYHSYHPGFATVILFALLQGTTVVAAESSNPLADAKPELMQVCAGCHGADGVAASEEYPSLGGQNEAYLIQALKDFRDGKRPSAIMRGIARELREEDVRTLARHYAAKPYQRKPQSIDADHLRVLGLCLAINCLPDPAALRRQAKADPESARRREQPPDLLVLVAPQLVAAGSAAFIRCSGTGRLCTRTITRRMRPQRKSGSPGARRDRRW